MERQRHSCRAEKDRFLPFIAAHEPDVLCLQETKAERGQIEIDLPGYHEYWNSAVKKGYSGTAIFARQKPLAVVNGFPGGVCQPLLLCRRADA